MSDDFAVIREEIELTKSWQALARIEARLAAAEAEPPHALSFAGQERQRATREARDAAIEALREAGDGLAAQLAPYGDTSASDHEEDDAERWPTIGEIHAALARWREAAS